MVNPSDDVKAVLNYSTELPAGRRWIGTRIKAESSLKIHPHRLHLNSLEFHMVNSHFSRESCHKVEHDLMI